MALAPVIAPFIGGVLQTDFGWRSIFFLLVIAAAGGIGVVFLLLPETLKTRAGEPVSAVSILSSYRVVARNPTYLAYLGLGATCYAGLFAWLSGASFVLQNLYGLTPFDFGIAFALGSVGYMVGSLISARLAAYVGLDAIIGIGACLLTLGGLGMMASLALGLASATSVVLPVAVYLAGLGMVLPQSIAGALTPFPERAGAASSLFGLVQQGSAAICGAAVGSMLGSSAWPLAGAVALMGLATLLVWLSTRRIRARVAHH